MVVIFFFISKLVGHSWEIGLRQCSLPYTFTVLSVNSHSLLEKLTIRQSKREIYIHAFVSKEHKLANMKFKLGLLTYVFLCR